ncbi:ribonuclease H [Senna tora]|uniref:Ribonuclease H n=1 Tax=Senna tora TaxID=362788 RepID=A0A834XDH4_9FABA|nr:ribonuclease H [Senna tora]
MIAMEVHNYRETLAISNRVNAFYSVFNDAEKDWKPPDEGWFKVNSDGSYRSHSDEISCGGMIRKDDGTWFSGFSKKLGKGSIFLAEIRGCNKYSPLFKLLQDFNELLLMGWQVLVRVINRCCKSVADKLAKSAQYSSFGLKIYDSPPMSCDSLYRDDVDKVLLAHRQDWKPPDEGWFKVNSDGSYWSHSDEISCGCVIRKDDGTWFSGFSCNKYSPLLKLSQGFNELLSRGWQVLVRVINRCCNSVADKLAKSAHYSSFSLKIYDSPPMRISTEVHNYREALAISNRVNAFDSVFNDAEKDWKPPDEGWFKVNSDGSYWSHSDEINCGCNKYNPLLKLSQDFNELLSRGWQIMVRVINRCCNSVADKLAKSAQYSSFALKIYDSPPMSCDSLYRDDIDKVLLAHRQVG